MAHDSQYPSEFSVKEADRAEEFLLRAARALSYARRETMFDDLVRSATELLVADHGVIGRYVEHKGVPCVETLASCINGQIVPNHTYRLAGTPCETVVGQQFRFYPDGVAKLFPEPRAQTLDLVGYTAYPLFNDDGASLGIFSVSSRSKLTAPRRAESLLRIFSERVVAEIHRISTEDELKASEERYRSIFNAAVDGLALLSPEGRIIDVNTAMEKLYGYDRQEMIGEKALRFASGPSRENAARFLNAVRDENFATMVDKAVHRDGNEFYIEPRGVTVNYRGRPHILAVIRDVTERTKAEEQQVILEAQLRQAQKMEAIGHLTGGVAHDFNNILTSVLGYVELAHDYVEDQRDEKLNRYLERAQRSGERARDLIQQMLTFSRGHQGEARPLQIGPVVQDIVSLLESMVPATVRISTQIGANLPSVTADPVHIEQVLVNLCLNARDAMEGGGSLHIEVGVAKCDGQPCSACHQEARGEYVEIIVRDSGNGMPPELIERIFEPFFSTKETGKGSGMGLSTTHGIVHEYGGHVVVDSTLGEGTTIRILIPATNPTVELNTETSPNPVSKGGVEFRGQVLLVDDNPEVAEFVTDLLEGWGLQVNTFNDSDAALKHFSTLSETYTFAILDQTMPAFTGLKLAELLMQYRQDLPIILYTGYSDIVDEEAANAVGIRALVRKPLEIEEFRHVVQDILDPTNI